MQLQRTKPFKRIYRAGGGGGGGRGGELRKEITTAIMDSFFEAFTGVYRTPSPEEAAQARV